MICANCKKEIILSFGKSGLNGCYCEDCAESFGIFLNIETRPKNIQALTPEQHIIKHIHCDISQEFLKDYKAEIERATARGIFAEIEKPINDFLNGEGYDWEMADKIAELKKKYIGE